MAMTTEEKLAIWKKVDEILATPANWTKHSMAKRPLTNDEKAEYKNSLTHIECLVSDPNATCWCLDGAVAKALSISDPTGSSQSSYDRLEEFETDVFSFLENCLPPWVYQRMPAVKRRRLVDQAYLFNDSAITKFEDIKQFIACNIKACAEAFERGD